MRKLHILIGLVAEWANKMKSFGDRLRESRIAAGLTQEQLGFALGVTKSSVSAWENGRETPSFKVLPELREALGASLDALVCGGLGSAPQKTGESDSVDLRATNASEKSLLVRFRALPPRKRDAVLELIKPGK